MFFTMFAAVGLIGCLIGYLMGADKRVMQGVMQELEIKQLRAELKAARDDADHWRQLYQGTSFQGEDRKPEG